MHKKKIGDKDYFYTSVRDSTGKVKTVYLGSNKKSAYKKEKELGLNSKKNLNLHLFFTILLFFFIFFTGFFAFTGFEILNITGDEDSNENLSSLGEEEVFADSFEDVQSTTPSNETSSSLIENESENISSDENITELSNISITDSLNLSINGSLNLSIHESLNKTLNISENISENISSSEEVIALNESINLSVQTLQYDVVINQPVKWKKKVLLSSPSDNVSVDIHKEAVNISVVEILNGSKQEVESSNIKINENGSNLVTGSAVLETNLGASIFGFFAELFASLFEFTGYGALEIEEEDIEEKIELIIEEEIEEIEIEYETPGPNSTEINFSDFNKQIIVYSDIHYENILAYTSIPDSDLSSINLYWLNNGSKEKVVFDGYDTNDNNLVDYVEWIVPHLSNQTYEIEITILNVQSYPTVGGDWTVEFNTTGTANLSIKSFNGTTWSNESGQYDLKFLDLNCGNNSVNYTWNNDSVFVEDYSCNSIGKETSEVITPGKHNLEFDFGGQKAYAYNDAGHTCGNISTSGTHTLTSNITQYGNNSNCIIINASHILFDCQGFIIDGADVTPYNITGLYLNGTTSQITNITIQNCNFFDFSNDIRLRNVTDSKIINTNFSSREGINDSFKAILAELSSNIIIENNTIRNTGSSSIPPAPLSGGIVLSGTSNTNVTNNDLDQIDGDGIFFTKAATGELCNKNLAQNNRINNTLSSVGGGQDYAAIRLQNCENATIHNNSIKSKPGCGANCNKFGIYLTGSKINNVTSNAVFNSSRDNLFATSSSNLNLFADNLLNFTITNLGEGIEIAGASLNNTVRNNTIYFSEGAGVVLDTGSNDNKFSSNIVLNNSFGGVEIYSSSNNTFFASNISGNNLSGLFFQNSSNNRFRSGILQRNDLAGGQGDIGFLGNNGKTEQFLNMSFNKSNINFTTGATGRLGVRWYIDVFVNSSEGAVQNANVSIFNKTNVLHFSELTAVTGFIVRRNLTEYVHNRTVQTFFTNYTLNTTKANHDPDTRKVNITGSRQDNITLNVRDFPNATFVTVTPASPNTFNDLNCSFNITDKDPSDTLFANFTWYKSGVVNITGQVTVLNATVNSTLLSNVNTSDGDNWTCGVRAFDGTNYDNETNSSVIIDTCGMNITTGGTYNLDSVMSCSDTAIYVGVSNAEFDCAGNSIYHSSSTNNAGIYLNGYNNFTLKKCNVIENNSGGLSIYNINISGSNSGNISNNNFTISNTAGVATQLSPDASNYTIKRNINIISGTSAKAAYILGKDNFYLDNVNATTIWINGEKNNLTNNSGIGGLIVHALGHNSTLVNNTGGSNLDIRGDENIILDNNFTSTSSTWESSLDISGNNNFVKNNIIKRSEDSSSRNILELGSSASENVLVNNILDSNGSTYLIKDLSSSSFTNYLVYNNTFGEIRYINTSNLSIQGGTARIEIGINPIITSNNTFVNSSLSGLNKSANITIFNTNALSYQNRVPYRNGNLCPTTICTELVDGDTYIFNVTQFSNYSVGETLNITNRTVINASGLESGIIKRGENITINATVIGDVSSVWTKIWQGIVGGPVLILKTLQNIVGDLWSADISTNNTFPRGDINFTIFANDTQGTEINDTGNFTITNIVPSVENVSLVSNDASNRTNGTLTGTYAFADLDEDPQQDNQTRWYINGTHNITFDNKTVIGSGNTSKDQNWTFSVRVSDGNFSSWVNSSVIFIQNSLPVFTSVNLTASNVDNKTTRSLLGNFSFTDNDGDSVIQNGTRWFINGVQNITFNNETRIGSGNTSKSQNWTFSIRIYDGDGYNSWVNSSNLTILNSAPVLNNVSSDAAVYTNGTTVTFTGYWSDNDEDNHRLLIDDSYHFTNCDFYTASGCIASSSSDLNSPTTATLTATTNTTWYASICDDSNSCNGPYNSISIGFANESNQTLLPPSGPILDNEVSSSANDRKNAGVSDNAYWSSNITAVKIGRATQRYVFSVNTNISLLNITFEGFTNTNATRDGNLSIWNGSSWESLFEINGTETSTNKLINKNIDNYVDSNNYVYLIAQGGEVATPLLGTPATNVSTDLMDLSILFGDSFGVVPVSCGDTVTSSITLESNLNNCVSDGLVVGASNIVIDCEGFTIDGDASISIGDKGIDNTAYSNVTVKNCLIKDFRDGIFFSGTSTDNSSIYNNSLHNNSQTGITLQGSSDHHNLSGNNMSDNGDYGIWLRTSDNNTVKNNYCINNTEGKVVTHGSSFNIISNNTCTGNSNSGILMDHDGTQNNTFVNNHLTGNTVRAIHDRTSPSRFGNVVVYNNSFGEIRWYNHTNLTMVSGLDFGTNLDITSNNTFFNTSAGLLYNRSANITIFNTNALSYQNRVPYRNGNLCPTTICTELVDGDTYIFNVTYFSNYSVGETLNITNRTTLNQSGIISDTIVRGNNLTINATVIGDVSSVWTKIWQGVVGGPVLILKTLQNIVGDLWSTDISTNTSFPFGQLNYTVFANDTQGTEINDTGNITIIDVNDAPNVTSINLRSATPNTFQDLNCTINVSDNDFGETLFANFTWYKNGVEHSSGQVTVLNATINSTILGEGNTTDGETWTCGVRAYDGTIYDNETNSSTVTISTCNTNITQSRTLDGNITGCTVANILNITSSDIVFDCDGYSIKGSGNTGLYINAVNNVTLRNCDVNVTGTSGAFINGENHSLFNSTIWAHGTGIQLSGSVNSNLTDIAVTVNTTNALIFSSNSNNNIVTNSNFTANTTGGVFLNSGNNNRIENSTIKSSGNNAIRITSANNSLIINNNITSTESKLIADTSGSTRKNTLVYNNSFGDVRWINTNLTINHSGRTLYFGRDFNISSNNVSLNVSKFSNGNNSGLNQSANITIYSVDSLIGSGDRKPLRNGADCPATICAEITDADSYLFNVTGFTDYSVGLVSTTAAATTDTISPGGSRITTYPEGKCGVDSDCEEGQSCVEGDCILPECTVNEDCSLDEKCVENTCTKLFDLRVLDVVDSSVTVGEEIEFTYYILAMSEIDNDVTVTYWLDDGKDITLSPELPGNCGDGYITGNEECDLGEKNTNIECIPEYGSSCSYCNLDCNLNDVRGPYCGDNVCNKEEDSFVCPEDCGKPSLGSKIVNVFKNIFKFTGFTVVGMVNQEVIYVGEVGDELELSSSLYVPTEVEPGTYELHIKLNYAGSEVEAIKTVEILELEEPELAPVEEKIEYFKYTYIIFLIVAIIVLIYLIFRAYREIKKLSRKISRLKRPRPKKKLTRKLTEREKLIKKIKKWKSKGYDTSVLEVKLGEIVPTKISKEEIKKKEFERRIKEWESKGYDATILRNRLGIKSKVVGVSRSEEKLLRNIDKFEKKIKDWKKKGYDTKILEERLKKLKRKY